MPTNAPTPPRPDEAPAPPWRATPDNGNNAKRAGWEAFFAGKRRDACPFPPAFHELHRAYQEGWDAAKEAPASSAPEPEDEAVARLERYLGQPFIVWTTEEKRQRDDDLRLVLSALASRAEEIAALREALEGLRNSLEEISEMQCVECGYIKVNNVARDALRAARALTPGEGGNGD